MDSQMQDEDLRSELSYWTDERFFYFSSTKTGKEYKFILLLQAIFNVQSDSVSYAAQSATERLSRYVINMVPVGYSTRLIRGEPDPGVSYFVELTISWRFDKYGDRYPFVAYVLVPSEHYRQYVELHNSIGYNPQLGAMWFHANVPLVHIVDQDFEKNLEFLVEGLFQKGTDY